MLNHGLPITNQAEAEMSCGLMDFIRVIDDVAFFYMKS